MYHDEGVVVVKKLRGPCELELPLKGRGDGQSLAHRLRGESVPQPTHAGRAGWCAGRAVQGSAWRTCVCGYAGVRLTLACHLSCPALPSRRGDFAGRAPGCSKTQNTEDFAGHSPQRPTSVPLVEHPFFFSEPTVRRTLHNGRPRMACVSSMTFRR
jgi:hypothetical protein